MKNSILTILLLCCSFLVFSQKQTDFEYTIQSKSFNKDRKIYVHIPEDYYKNETNTYGVIYVLDGQGKEYFSNAKSIIDYLVWSYQIMPVIVVGIHSNNRHTEFIPKDRTLAKDDSNNNGEALLLTNHIKNEIFPLIEEKYRVTEFRALIGHSRGGAFVANTIFSKNKDLFNAYLAISPGMHYVNNQILNDAEKMITSNAKFNKFYYCSYGTVGSLEKYFKPQVEYIDSLLQKHPNKTLIWRKKEFKNTTHWSTVAPSLAYGLLEMNRNYKVDQLLIDRFSNNPEKSIASQIEDFYEKQHQILGYTIPISASTLRYYGSEYKEDERYKKTIELLNLSLEKDPNAVATYWEIAMAYKNLKNIPQAKSNIKRALTIIETGKTGWNNEKIERWKKIINDELQKL
jgi:predicted alpha/beta superfamily hydrolase